MRNNSIDTLRDNRGYLTLSDRKFLANVSGYARLTWAQRDVVDSIARRARRRRRLYSW